MSPDGPAEDPGTAAASCPRCISVSIESIQVVNSRIQAWLKSTRNKAGAPGLEVVGGGVRTLTLEV